MSILQKAIVSAIRLEAKGILSIELQPKDGTGFATFDAGAYVDLHLPNHLVRSYSLLNAPDEKNRYVIGVLHDIHSRGGSAYIHQVMRVGDELNISLPFNNFQLKEDANHTVLVAGGIGITPLYCMLNRLIKLGRSVELIYCASSREEAAYLDRLEKLDAKIICHFDDEKKQLPHFEQYLANRPVDSHFYCCGPVGMLKAFELACEKFDYANVHTELFSINRLTTGDINALHNYQVVLAKSKEIIEVLVGASLLDTLISHGVTINSACREGVCGACKTKVLDGVPDHHDGVLSPQEKRANNLMLPCVSGCKGDRLVLDL